MYQSARLCRMRLARSPVVIAAPLSAPYCSGAQARHFASRGPEHQSVSCRPGSGPSADLASLAGDVLKRLFGANHPIVMQHYDMTGPPVSVMQREIGVLEPAVAVHDVGTLPLDHPAQRCHCPGRALWGGMGKRHPRARPSRLLLHPRIRRTRTPSSVSSTGWSPVWSITTVTAWPRRTSSRERVSTCRSRPPMMGR